MRNRHAPRRPIVHHPDLAAVTASRIAESRSSHLRLISSCAEKFLRLTDAGRSSTIKPSKKRPCTKPPEDCAVIGDLNVRRGQMQMQRQAMRGSASVIIMMVPLMNMFGYANNLRTISRGRATFTMQFDHFADAPLPPDDPPFRPAIGMRG